MGTSQKHRLIKALLSVKNNLLKWYLQSDVYVNKNQNSSIYIFCGHKEVISSGIREQIWIGWGWFFIILFAMICFHLVRFPQQDLWTRQRMYSNPRSKSFPFPPKLSFVHVKNKSTSEMCDFKMFLSFKIYIFLYSANLQRLIFNVECLFLCLFFSPIGIPLK